MNYSIRGACVHKWLDQHSTRWAVFYSTGKKGSYDAQKVSRRMTADFQ